MQTFLPYPSFSRSARALDTRRLGKQRVETLQILNSLTGRTLAWRNHPAVVMWRDYEEALVAYGLVVSREWQARGYQDTCFDKIACFSSSPLRARRPPWLGDAKLHRSHQACLVRKDPAYYRPLFPDVDETLELYWPPGRRAEEPRPPPSGGQTRHA